MSIRPSDHGVLASQGGVIADVVAYGGMINQYLDAASGNTYRTHTFRGKGGWLEVISNPLNRTADILIVAGGGNAIGDYSNQASGGGGAGGVRLITGETMSTGVKTMVVGRGGVRYSAAYAGNNGSDTWFTGWTAPYPTADGGGAGQVGNGATGGSGGGGSSGTGGSGNASGVSPAEGNDGGDGSQQGSYYTGGGGGGFGGAGADGSGSRGGNGGDGGWSIGWTKASHAGTSTNGVKWGGGGGGCERSGTTHGNGSSGGGGAGGKPGSTTGWGQSGVPNTGGGAGASTDTFIGSSGGLTTDSQFTGGGSGIIIVRYQVQEAA